MRFPNSPNDEQLQGAWEALGAGTPTIAALAALCGQALRESAGQRDTDAELLGPEALAILYAARERGLMEIKAVNTAFESPERLLAVHVEQEPERGIVFRSRRNPEYTIRFLGGFRQLCAAGLVIHHLFREFSLSEQGFARARDVQASQVQQLLEQAAEYG